MSHAMNALPDPTYDPAFYDGVLPKRFFAWVIDVVLIVLTVLVLGLVSAGIAFLFWPVVHALVAFVYRWITIRNRSATFGMRVMAIELRGPTGAPLSSGEAALHTLSFLVAATIMLVQLISIAMMIGRPLNRGLADEITGAVMLNRAG